MAPLELNLARGTLLWGGAISSRMFYISFWNTEAQNYRMAQQFHLQVFIRRNPKH